MRLEIIPNRQPAKSKRGFSKIEIMAISFTLLTFGLSMFVKSLSADITDVIGLADFFVPSSHEITVDKIIADVFKEHLDSLSRLKWDEFRAIIEKSMLPDYKYKIIQEEPDENPVDFAIEKLLLLSYLEYQGILSFKQVLNELKEIMTIPNDQYDYEQGADIGLSKRYFSRADLHKIFEDLIARYSKPFFKILDRLQLELLDNFKSFASQEVYFDVACDERVILDKYLSLFIIIFNNSPKKKEFKLNVISSGFFPKIFELSLEVEGRGALDLQLIAQKLSEPNPPLISSEGEDAVNLMSEITKNSDSVWLSLNALEKGEQTIQVFLMDEMKNVIKGITLTVETYQDFASKIKTGGASTSVLTGLITALAKIYPTLAQQFMR